MKRPCCIDSINNSSDSSSCSMVLRSACSHGRSHKSLISTDLQKQESIQRKRKFLKDSSSENSTSVKDSSNKNSKSVKVSSNENSEPIKTSSNNNLNSNYCKESSKCISSLESSLENLSLKSSKTFSILKEHLYNQLHFSGNQKCKFTQLDQEDFSCIKKLNFSETSSPITSLHLNTQYESTKLSDEIQSIERDYNFNTTNMSRTRNLNRSSLRALSGSDTEEDVSFSSNRVRLKRNRGTAALSHLNSSGDQVSSQSHSDIYVSSNHKSVAESISASSTTSSRATAAKNSYTYTPSGSSGSYQRNASVNSSQANISAVQYSSILDRLRWLLWKYIYLKIIKIVNFDVWLLSRLCGRPRVVIVFLLPLLLYLLYCLLGSGTELASTSLDVLSSSVSALASSVYSLIIFPFQQSEEAVKEGDPLFGPKRGSFLSAFWGIPSFFSNFFISEKTTSFTSQTTSHTVDSRIKSDNSITKQDIELLAVKTLDARFNELVKKMQTSQDVKAEAMNSLQKEISDLHVQFKSLTSTIQQLEKDIKTDKEHVVVFDSLNIRMKDFEEKLTSLSGLKKCCDEKWTVADFTASIEKHLVTAFRNVMAGEKNTDSPYHFFHQWLNSKFVDPNKLSAEINAAFEKMKRQQSSDIKLDQNSMNVVKSFVQHYVETLKTNLTPAGSTETTYDNSLTHHEMRRIVKEALMLYDADKTGKVDYALESGGGSILSTRCSESYVEKNGKFTVLGVPLWSDENSPRTAIQPDVQPGKCWAFKGSHGYLVIQLSYTVYPTGFTLEHIPVSLSPSGSIDSAPKDFSVWGLSSDKDFEGTLLGKYTFAIDGDPLQYFEVQNTTSVPFSLVELKIHSNHGNLEYTCLYRFRVHGTRA